MMCHDDMTLFRHNGDSVTNRHSDRVTKGALIAPEIATMRLDIPASSVGANGPYGIMCREDMTLFSHQGKRTMMRQAMTPDRIRESPTPSRDSASRPAPSELMARMGWVMTT